jgi:hypothetical protein
MAKMPRAMPMIGVIQNGKPKKISTGIVRSIIATKMQIDSRREYFVLILFMLLYSVTARADFKSGFSEMPLSLPPESRGLPESAQAETPTSQDDGCVFLWVSPVGSLYFRGQRFQLSQKSKV